MAAGAAVGHRDPGSRAPSAAAAWGPAPRGQAPPRIANRRGHGQQTTHAGPGGYGPCAPIYTELHLKVVTLLLISAGSMGAT